MTQLAFTFDQRWQDRREYRLRPGARIDPTEYGIDAIHERDARAFLGQHHYAGGALPPVRLAIGLMRKPGIAPARLVGVAVFSVPMNQSAIPTRTGMRPDQGCELGRFACAPEVLYNGESWFLARAFRLLRQEKPEIQTVLSYADPVERRTTAGVMVKPGHFGSCYQALNAAFCGRSAPRAMLLAADGSVLSPRTLAKARSGDRGRRYAREQLARLGIHDPHAIDAAVEAGVLTRVYHSGNLAYTFALTDDARAALKATWPEPAPYPKKDRMAA